MKRFAVLVAMIGACLTLTAVDAVRAQRAAPPGAAVQANRAPHPAPEQPLPFSHRTHVSRGLRCQVCHTNPEPGAHMTFPASSTCMGCHVSVAKDRAAIVTLTDMARSNQPIPWVRVYQVLPGVTWTHRKHLEAGAQCAQCHGNVGESDTMSEVTAVTGMSSCVSCHQARKASTACVTCHEWPTDN
jgi:hypothetical protein